MFIDTPSRAALSRRRVLISGAAAVAATVCLPGMASAAGTIRRINLVNPRNGERLDAVYYAHGAYDREVLGQLNTFLRDWRTSEETRIDLRLIDIASATQYLLRTDRPFQVISGYRSKASNDMLRRRSRGVAKKSYHTRGKAMDVRMDGVPAGEIAKVVRALDCGGSGLYTASNFTHIDSGPVRTWGV